MMCHNSLEALVMYDRKIVDEDVVKKLIDADIKRNDVEEMMRTADATGQRKESRSGIKGESPAASPKGGKQKADLPAESDPSQARVTALPPPATSQPRLQVVS
jgi:hypothetical protein